MRMILLAAVMVLIGVWGTTASAGAFISGNKLYDFCKNYPGSKDRPETCSAYVIGIMVAMSYNIPEGSLGTYRFCLSDGVRASQAADIVTAWLANNPKDRHIGAAGIVAQALSQAWPCKE